MGAPKQKWTQDEEAALKAGVNKHGAGKWRTILKDPEFSNMLRNRSNVDLKDKWRNMSVTAHGLGSREKARIALKNSRQTTKHDGTSMVVVKDIENEVLDVEPLAAYSEPPQISSQKKSISRLDNLILEAIINLKEPTGSNKTAISSYIEDQYCPPADFKELLSEKLKALTASRRLIKVKHKYRITPTSAYSKEKSSKFLAEGQQEEPRAKIKPLTKSQIDAELAQMRNMSAQEAAAVAARAVAEAEAAMAEAEAAAREAEAAEADAEAAQAFAEAAMLTLKNRNVHKQMVRV
ncbi:single myb histone 6-like isoform X2 [Zingiber officinale]|uniref:single myb histone 6-like isoform X2 n=1 Tax=Zingiber officinale TaxID=94328 RepID=UPI001C4AE063|nr:single myb histone 6-like isoform X2 [Zingiber officinale]